MSRKYYSSFRLFPRPTLLTGLGTSFNIFGNSYTFNYSSSGEEADFKAIENDWGVIGLDIEKTMQEIPKEKAKEKLQSLVCE